MRSSMSETLQQDSGRVVRVSLASEEMLVEPERREDLRADFLDRRVRRREHLDVVAFHELLRLRHFVATLFQRRVARAGLALLADLLEADGIDCEAEQLRAMAFQALGQFL